MPRLLRVGGSFAIVLTVYWAYALLAVPWIEPSVDLQHDRPIDEGDRQRLRPTAARVRELKSLFHADAWELANPKILESERLKLLMQDYRNLGDGRVEITPCTLIFLPEEPADDPVERHRRAIVLEARQGAILRFDEPIDPLRGKIGRPIGGELVGKITIRSQGQTTSPEDDLLIVTRDVELTQRHVWTPHEVEFQWGRSHGRGRRLHIELLEEKRRPGSGREGPSIAGIKLFELKEIDRVHVELAGVREALSRAKNDDKPDRQKPLSALAEQPIELKCRGPFAFDVPGKRATLKDQVDLWRIHPDGPSDQLSCELLTLHFVDREGEPAADGGEGKASSASLKDRLGDSLALKLERIEALGDPVIVSLPSRQASARGRRLEYDALEQHVRLDGGDEVMLKQGENEVHARSVDYRAGPDGQPGEVYAKGPGWMRGRMDDRPEEHIEARWNKLLEIRPQHDNHLVSLTGGSALRYSGIGQLDAKEIHFWVRQTEEKSAERNRDFQPDRMLARGDVHVSSEKLSCVVEEMKIWFEQTTVAAAPMSNPVGRSSTSSHTIVGRSVSPSYTTVPSRPPFVRHMSYHTPARGQHFEVLGRQLLGEVLIAGGRQVALSELTIRDGVKLVETETARPDEQPVSVEGDFVQVVDADKPHAAVTVTGEPAAFAGRGLALRGPRIHLDRGANRLSIDGAGRMDVRLDRDLEGRPLSAPSNLQVDFSRAMLFDGRTAEFSDVVRATAPNAQLDTQTLKVQFQKPIRFSDRQAAERAEVERVECRGGALMQSRTYEAGKQVGEEWIEVADLAIHVLTGDVKASGPGWLTSVRRGIANPIAGGNLSEKGAAESAATEPDAGPPEDRRSGLHIRFEGSAAGNFQRRDLTFYNRVQTAFAPVDGWTEKLPVDDPDALPVGGVAMQCDRLGVHEMAAPISGRPAMELEAAENVVVEGRIADGYFTARSVRMTYTEDKGLLVLEGNGHTPAELFRQQQIGGPQSRLAAGRIMYWPKTNRFMFNDPQAVEINGLPSGGLTP